MLSDDFADVETYCTFGDERVYILLAIARGKEQSDTDEPRPTIREVVREPEQLRRKAEQLAHAVSRFDATYRLYVTANARDVTAALFRFRASMDDWLEMRLNGDRDVVGKFKRLDSEFKSVLQRDECRDETRFVFDLDDVSRTEADRLRQRLADETTVLLDRDTPNGVHLVCEPFDYTSFDADVAYELKTDGLVFVSYIGE